MAEAVEEKEHGLLLLLASIAVVVYRLITMAKPPEKREEQAPTLHESSDSCIATYYEEVLSQTPIASGIDPNDPLWSPPDGWTHVHAFANADEIAQVFNDICGYESVENGVLLLNPPPGEMSCAWRYYANQSWKRVAVCLKIKVVNIISDTSNIIYFNPVPTTDRFVGVGFHAITGSQALKIKDWNTGGGWFDPPLHDFAPPDDWIVIVVDNTPGQTPFIRIYNRNKDTLFSLNLLTDTSTRVYEDLWFEADNATGSGTWDVKIDWIAFKY